MELLTRMLKSCESQCFTTAKALRAIVVETGGRRVDDASAHRRSANFCRRPAWLEEAETLESAFAKLLTSVLVKSPSRLSLRSSNSFAIGSKLSVPHLEHCVSIFLRLGKGLQNRHLEKEEIKLETCSDVSFVETHFICVVSFSLRPKAAIQPLEQVKGTSSQFTPKLGPSPCGKTRRSLSALSPQLGQRNRHGTKVFF